MKRQQIIIKPKTISNFSSWFALSVVALLIIVGLAILIDIGILGASPIALAWILYLFYRQFYLPRYKILLNCPDRKLTIIKPFSKVTLSFGDVYFLIKKIGFRSPSFIIIIMNISNKKIIRLFDDDWENIRSVVVLPHESNLITKSFQSKWR